MRPSGLHRGRPPRLDLRGEVGAAPEGQLSRLEARALETSTPARVAHDGDLATLTAASARFSSPSADELRLPAPPERATTSSKQLGLRRLLRRFDRGELTAGLSDPAEIGAVESMFAALARHAEVQATVTRSRGGAR